MAMMLITHDLAVLAENTQNLAVMNNGKIQDHGKTKTVFTAQKNRFTQSLVKASEFKPLPKKKTEKTAPAPLLPAPLLPAPLLDVHDVVVRYPKANNPAVDHVSLTISLKKVLVLWEGQDAGNPHLPVRDLGA